MNTRPLLLLSLMAALTTARADSLLEQARRAAAEGVDAVAVAKLRQFLATPHNAAETGAARILLARALLRNGQGAEAVRTLEGLTGDAAELLRGECLLASGNLKPAREAFARVNTPVARLGEAEAWRAMGRGDEAVRILAQLDGGPALRLRLAELQLERRETAAARATLSSIQPKTALETAWKLLLDARLLLQEGQADQAAARTQALLQERELFDALRAGATLVLAEAHAARHQNEQAAALLEEFISRNPGSRHLGLMFEVLDRLTADQPDAATDALAAWAGETDTARSVFAQFHLARAEARTGSAAPALERLRRLARTHPDHPLAARANLVRARLLAAENRKADALEALEDAMRSMPDSETFAEAELLAGTLHFQAGEFLVAANLFENAAGRSWNLRAPALFNAALAWLRVGNTARFLDNYKALSAHAPESPLRRDLVFGQGMMQAARNSPEAAATLQRFLRDFPEPPRNAQATLALAELAFLALPPHREEAAGYLRAVTALPADPATAERADFLAMFLADDPAAETSDQAVAACEKFLKTHPASPLVPEARMKLGQIFFRRQEYLSARMQLEKLARDAPTSPLAEGALFLAAQSSLRMMTEESVGRALELFDEVARLNGPLQLHARFHQAVAQARLGQHAAALALYDAVLEGTPDPELKAAALAGRGDTLLTVTATDPSRLPQALEAFDRLSQLPGLTPDWRNQALYKKGRCLEKMDRADEALAAWYDILDAARSGATVPELFWFSKAGFEAARLLEERQQWRAAVGIYSKIAAVKGPQADEARLRADRLRLEHFLWEE